MLSELSVTGLYGYSVVFLIVSLVAIYVIAKTGPQLRPVARFMNSFLVVCVVVVAAFLFAMAWSR